MIIPNENLSVDQVRLLLREETNRYDSFFLGYAMAKGALGPNFALPIPTGVKRISGSNDDRARTGGRTFGKSNQPKLRYKGRNNKSRVLPEAKYNPSLISKFEPGVKLAKNITLSSFLKNGNLNTLSSENEKRQVARNLYMQTFMIQSFESLDRFRRLSLEISEGYYTPLEGETVSGIRQLQSLGRAVVYKVKNKDNEIDHAATYELAVHWSKTQLFNEIILSYDTVDPNLRYSSEIIVTVPNVLVNYRPTFSNKISTQFNYRNALQDGFAELFV